MASGFDVIAFSSAPTSWAACYEGHLTLLEGASKPLVGRQNGRRAYRPNSANTGCMRLQVFHLSEAELFGRVGGFCRKVASCGKTRSVCWAVFSGYMFCDNLHLVERQEVCAFGQSSCQLRVVSSSPLHAGLLACLELVTLRQVQPV